MDSLRDLLDADSILLLAIFIATSVYSAGVLGSVYNIDIFESLAHVLRRRLQCLLRNPFTRAASQSHQRVGYSLSIPGHQWYVYIRGLLLVRQPLSLTGWPLWERRLPVRRGCPARKGTSFL